MTDYENKILGMVREDMASFRGMVEKRFDDLNETVGGGNGLLSRMAILEQAHKEQHPGGSKTVRELEQMIVTRDNQVKAKEDSNFAKKGIFASGLWQVGASLAVPIVAFVLGYISRPSEYHQEEKPTINLVEHGK